jgi:transcriptional regulator with AAA-type ATPase domain/ferredoxin
LAGPTEKAESGLAAGTENREEILLFLSRVPLFQTLPKSSLEEIVRAVEVEAFPRGTRLIRQGESGDSFYILRSGEARVTTMSEDGLESFLATLRAGDCLGEMALLTGEPRAANVTLSQDSVLYVLYKDEFDGILHRNPTLYRHFTSLLVQRLKGSNLLIEQEREREAALSRFLHLDPSARPPELVGHSRAIAEVRERIRALAPLSVPVVVRGERGAGRELAARMIHQMGSLAQGPFVVANCLAERRRRRLPVPRERRHRDQMACNLLGHERGAFPGAVSRQIGLLELAHEGTLLVRNAEHLPYPLLEALARASLKGEVHRLGGGRAVPVRVRVILTWTDGQPPEKEAVLEKFSRQVGAQTLRVPPLRERRRDIPLLVEHFMGQSVRRSEEEGGLRLSREALNRLMHYDFPGNVAELESVIRRGVLLARGAEIFPEEIHLGVPKVEGRAKFNLLRIPWVHRLLGPMDAVGMVRKGVALGLLAMIPVALWGVDVQVAGEPLVLLLTWKVWWPLLLVSLFLAGRIWCGICPVYTIAGVTQRWRKNIPIPGVVARWGRWMAVGGFFVLAWVESYLGLVGRPRETGIVLAGVVLGAIVVGLLFQRNAWCRYLCPLGTMASVYAVASVTEVRANRSLCLSTCTEHACYKGTADRPGCPMYQHPLFFQNNMNCRFCFQCVNNCPHGAVQLNLRLPAEEAWTMEERPAWSSLFARMLSGFVLFQALNGRSPLVHGMGWGLPDALAFTLVLLLPVAAVLGIHALADGLSAFTRTLSFGRAMEIYGFAGVPLALMGHLAVKVGESLGPIPATMILFERHFLHWDVTRALQGAGILLGLVLSGHLLLRLRSVAGREVRGAAPWVTGIQAAPIAAIALSLWGLLGMP